MERLFWTFLEFFGKCPLIRDQLALPYNSLNVLEFKVSTGLWSRVCPQELQKWPLLYRAEGRSVGSMYVGQMSHADANGRQKKLFAKWYHLGDRKTLESFDSVPHFAWSLTEAALCFSVGDHAGINCQTCLTPPCHLIIACNTLECWQCWAIDSWHSLKLLIIFSHKPLSDLSTSLYCL